MFDDLNLVIQAGEKVGIVGRSGAGKSTLVNLLLRFYDVQSGQIRIDGQDISHVSQESLRRHIGMITQDTSLLHRSIRDNICTATPMPIKPPSKKPLAKRMLMISFRSCKMNKAALGMMFKSVNVA